PALRPPGPPFCDTSYPEPSHPPPRKQEPTTTPGPACRLPPHWGAAAAARHPPPPPAPRHKIPVLEDACQAHLAEWKGKKVSTLGELGCFSFQASKNLNSGEGGAILTNNDELYQQCKSFQNNGRGQPGAGFSYARNGANLRMT